jgi:two-component system, OmpR family, heavy metal sensor histidine kinase CusS
MSLKNAKPWSITARLTFLYILSASVILLSIGWYLHQTLANTLAQDNRQFLLKEIQLLRTLLQKQPPNLERLADEQSEGIDLPVGRYYSRILDETGHSLIETPGMQSLPPAVQFPAPVEMFEVSAVVQKNSDGRTLMLMTAGSKATPQQTIQIALYISHEAALLSSYRRNLIGALFLVSAFNGMLLRLAKSFAQLTQFSADLAHELRTPINNLMGETEVALARSRNADEYREILESNLEEYGRLSRIVETLLFLARAENTEIPLRTARPDGRAELEAVCSYHEALDDEKGIRLVCRGQGFLHADAQLFKRVPSNLLLNALQHTPTGGEICLSLHPANDGSAEVIVQDTGCGIAAEHLPKMFDRFYRVDSARSEEGTGLGLTIVKSIMDLHCGSLVIDSTLGKGTVVKLPFSAK